LADNEQVDDFEHPRLSAVKIKFNFF
jgi:hypothetical protein